MQKDVQIVMGLVVVCLVIIATGMFLASNDLQAQQNKADVQQETISAQYPVLAAEFHSPEVIIKTDDIRSFLTMAKQVNASVVYKTQAEGYVVVDNDFKYAYNLPVTYPIVNFGYILMIILPLIVLFMGLWLYAMVSSY